MNTEFVWLALVGIVALAMQTGIARGQNAAAGDVNQRTQAFIAEYEAKVRPLEIATSRAWWTANTSGKDEDFAAKEEAQNQLDEALSDARDLPSSRRLRKASLPIPSWPARSPCCTSKYLEKQVPPELLREDHGEVATPSKRRSTCTAPRSAKAR